MLRECFCLQHLDVLGVGNETVLLQRLLKHGASFAPRRIVHSSGSSLQPAMATGRNVRGLSIIEGKYYKCFCSMFFVCHIVHSQSK